MIVMVDGRPVDVGERRQLRGEELRALAAIQPGRELWQVVPDLGARYDDVLARVPVHDERVRDTSVVALGNGSGPARRFFTAEHAHLP
jgi:hypothetical protein